MANQSNFKPGEITALKPLDYPPKILLAWGEAIDGNAKIRNWLMKNGYPELGIFVFAMHNQDEARGWLAKNGYGHLLAMINGGEGNERAVLWLKSIGENILAHMALAMDRDERAFEWLLKNKHKMFALLARKMRVCKDMIDDNNHDPHHINP